MRSSPSLRGRPFIEARVGCRMGRWRVASPSLRGRPFIEASARPRHASRSGSTRRPFEDGPSSRLADLQRQNEALKARRPFEDGPSSRLHERRPFFRLLLSSPSLRGRPFIEAGRCIAAEAARALAVPSRTALHRGWVAWGGPFSFHQLAVPSRTALHRGTTTTVGSVTMTSRRPFEDGPSSRLVRDGLVRPMGDHSPSLRGRPFIEAPASPAGSTVNSSTRRPFEDGPSSRRVHVEDARHGGLQLAVPSRTALHRGFACCWSRVLMAALAVPSRTALHRGIDNPDRAFQIADLAVPSRTALHRGIIWTSDAVASTANSPSLRGRPFIEAVRWSIRGWQGLLAVHSRTALHRGGNPHHGWVHSVSSPSLRGRPFIEAPRTGPPRTGPPRLAVPSRTALHRGPSRWGRTACTPPSPSLRGRPFIEAAIPSTFRPILRSLAVPSRTALHRGNIPFNTNTTLPGSPSLRGRPFIEAGASGTTHLDHARLAVPSRTALHRGGDPIGAMVHENQTRRPFEDGPSSRHRGRSVAGMNFWASPSLRGRPFIEAWIPASWPLQRPPARRPFEDGPSSRLVRSVLPCRSTALLAVPSRTALHRGLQTDESGRVNITLAVPSRTALHRGDTDGVPYLTI